MGLTELSASSVGVRVGRTVTVPGKEDGAAERIRSAKQAVRDHVWKLLEGSGAAIPPGPYGRIPMFQGAEAAAERLAGLPEWRSARVVKANPDWAQMPVRVASRSSNGHPSSAARP